MRPGQRGRLLSIGGSKSAGNLMMCQANDAYGANNIPTAELMQRRDAFYTWQSLVATQLDLQASCPSPRCLHRFKRLHTSAAVDHPAPLQFSVLAMGGASLTSAFPCETNADWIFRTLKNPQDSGDSHASTARSPSPTLRAQPHPQLGQELCFPLRNPLV